MMENKKQENTEYHRACSGKTRYKRQKPLQDGVT
jgi:hypothetical protein